MISKHKQPEIATDDFLKLLTENFPAIHDEVYDEDFKGLIHLQVAAFARYTNECIEKNKLNEVKTAFIFFDAVINKVGDDVENALYVSYLEHLDMEGDGQNQKQARNYLKAEYLEVWRKLRE